LIDRHASAIVSNPKLEIRICRLDCDLHLCRMGMTEDVRKGFLDYSQHSALPFV